LFHAAYELLLLTRRQTIANTCAGTVQELPDHGTDAALHLSGKDLIGELLKACSEPRKL